MSEEIKDRLKPFVLGVMLHPQHFPHLIHELELGIGDNRFINHPPVLKPIDLAYP